MTTRTTRTTSVTFAGWLKLLVAGTPEDRRAALCWRTARRLYDAGRTPAQARAALGLVAPAV